MGLQLACIMDFHLLMYSSTYAYIDKCRDGCLTLPAFQHQFSAQRPQQLHCEYSLSLAVKRTDMFLLLFVCLFGVALFQNNAMLISLFFLATVSLPFHFLPSRHTSCSICLCTSPAPALKIQLLKTARVGLYKFFTIGPTPFRRPRSSEGSD